MKENKYIEITGKAVTPMKFCFDETDFNEMVKRYKITGVSWSELLLIGEGKIPDRPIQFGDNLFDADGYPRYAYDFMIDAVQAKFYENHNSWEFENEEDTQIMIEESEVRVDK